MVLCSFDNGVPLKFQKKHAVGLQFTSTDYLSLVLSPLRIRKTIPLTRVLYSSLGTGTISLLVYKK
jgi:hypothetical protein